MGSLSLAREIEDLEVQFAVVFDTTRDTVLSSGKYAVSENARLDLLEIMGYSYGIQLRETSCQQVFEM